MQKKIEEFNKVESLEIMQKHGGWYMFITNDEILSKRYVQFIIVTPAAIKHLSEGNGEILFKKDQKIEVQIPVFSVGELHITFFDEEGDTIAYVDSEYMPGPGYTEL